MATASRSGLLEARKNPSHSPRLMASTASEKLPEEKVHTRPWAARSGTTLSTPMPCAVPPRMEV